MLPLANGELASDRQLLLAWAVALALFVVGVVMGRWLCAVLPLFTLLALHLWLSDADNYSRVPEEWQVVLYVALGIGGVLAAVGVLIRKVVQRRALPRG